MYCDLRDGKGVISECDTDYVYKCIGFFFVCTRAPCENGYCC